MSMNLQETTQQEQVRMQLLTKYEGRKNSCIGRTVKTWQTEHAGLQVAESLKKLFYMGTWPQTDISDNHASARPCLVSIKLGRAKARLEKCFLGIETADCFHQVWEAIHILPGITDSRGCFAENGDGARGQDLKFCEALTGASRV